MGNMLCRKTTWAGGKHAVGVPLQDDSTEGKHMLKALLLQGEVSEHVWVTVGEHKLKLERLPRGGEGDRART
jgi:hypothetical protein